MEPLSVIWKSDGLSPEEIQQVRRHLEAVVASTSFAGSKRASDFLQLVVGHALDGDFDALRERMIGSEMFGRPIDYDTGSDSVVRVKATEVRRKLSQFYAENEHAKVRMELPSGSYVPRFCFQSPNSIGSGRASDVPNLHTEPVAVSLPQSTSEAEIDPKVRGAIQSNAGRRARFWPFSTSVRYRAAKLAIAALVLLALMVIGLRLWLVVSNTAAPIHSLAVLPLENHSGVPAQEYFADGLTAELIKDFGQVSSLHLTTLPSVSSYRSSTKSPQEIAHELSVDGLVQGSVLREGKLVLINVRLTEAKTGKLLWMHSYVRELTTALAWQGEIAQTVAKTIDQRIRSKQALPLPGAPPDPVAEDLYLHGKYLLEAEDCVNAADFFRAAINVSFNYPQAQASLAFCDGHLGETDRIDSIDAFSMQKIEAQKAVDLDDRLADGHAELANAAINLNWDWATAATEFRRALELSPKSASIHEEYERYLARTGRIRETLSEIHRNEDMDPFSSRLYHLEGLILYDCRQYDDALLLIEKVRTLDIPQPNWHFLLGEIYTEKKDYVTAQAEFARAGERPQANGHLGNMYAREGKVQDAMELIRHLEESVRTEGVGRYEIALIYAGLGKKDEAFKWLEEAYKVRDEGLTYLKIDPCLDPLRSDPRFDDLLSHLGLTQ
jgi:TolB-like protein